MTDRQAQYVQNMTTSSPTTSPTQPLMVAVGRPRVVNFASSAVKGFSICQIVVGASLIILGIAAVIIPCAVYYFAAPIWCGVYIHVTGFIGLLAVNKQTKCTIIASMVCSIIAAILAGTVLLAISILIISVEEDWEYAEYGSIHLRYFVDSMVIVLAGAEVVIAILSSVFCCRPFCCGKEQHQQPSMYYIPAQPRTTEQQVTMDTGNLTAPNVVNVPHGLHIVNQSQGAYILHPLLQAWQQGTSYYIQPLPGNQCLPGNQLPSGNECLPGNQLLVPSGNECLPGNQLPP